jgi:hypothetical protein
VAQINFQKGLRDLAEKYRSRLASEGRLSISAEKVSAEVHRIRKEIAAHDYPAGAMAAVRTACLSGRLGS